VELEHQIPLDGDSLAHLAGCPVVRFFPHLCRLLPEIEELRFETFRPRPGIDERLDNLLASKKTLREAIEKVRPSQHFPLWEAAATVCMTEGAMPDEFIHTALLHEPNPTTVSYALSAESVVEGAVTVLSQGAVGEDSVAVCSRVRLASGVEAHIPMLDFRCPVSEANTKAIMSMLRLLGERTGLVVASGRSYHYYGVALYNHCQWIEFMAKALLLSPITDGRFIAHRVVDGQCRLRIYSPSRPIPVVVGVLQNAD
jgi:hypothetical protein